jgi:hypothetical protein
VHGEFKVTPILFEGDEAPESSDVPLQLQELRRLPFYRNVVSEWPHSIGDPEKLFGLGTWDPFLNIENRLAKEFERLPTREKFERSPEPPKKKSWWQFW